jgi:hypothetical protein
MVACAQGQGPAALRSASLCAPLAKRSPDATGALPQARQPATVRAMSKTDLTSLSPSHAPARGRAQPGEVNPKVRAVIERMVELGEPWDQAARAIGMTARSMRKQLERPAVIQLLRRRKEVARAAASAGNIKHLVELREQRTNLMAATKAIQLLEGIGDEAPHSSALQTVPGLVIVINGAGSPRAPTDASKLVVDSEPARVSDSEREGR